MEKMLMPPHLPGIKTALFTKQIIMINKGVVPLGSFKSTNRAQNNNKKPKGYLWNEAIQGWLDEDIASVVMKFLCESRYQDCKNITIWCGNCSRQNKNWTLYSNVGHHLFQSEALTFILETLTFKYFEKGHPFISTDSFYCQVEDRIWWKNHFYDFNKFVECVDSVGKACLMVSGLWTIQSEQLNQEVTWQFGKKHVQIATNRRSGTTHFGSSETREQ